MHIAWKVPFEAGTLKAVSRKAGKVVKETEIRTAGEAVKINLQADKTTIKNDGYELVYVTVSLQDKNGNPLLKADNLINFNVSGGAKIVGVDNGYQASLEPFKADYRKLYNGKCLVILQSNKKAENITLEASTAGNISAATLNIKVE